jgi:hypothetical protein
MEKIQLKEKMPEKEKCGYYKTLCLKERAKNPKYILVCETGLICPMFFEEESLGLDRYEKLKPL